jgi:hypothetical protein
MLNVLVPVAALLTHNTDAKVEAQPDCNANAPVAHAKGITQPASDASPWIPDGGTRP